MKKRRIYFYVVLCAIVAALTAVAVVWILCAPANSQVSVSNYSRFGVGQLITQITLSLLTLGALFWSFCGNTLKNYLHGPDLKLVVAKDTVHCVLDDAVPVQGPSGSKQPVLCVYAHVENASKAVATNCQLISSRVYVSVDGVGFYPYKSWQTASYKWLYEPSENQNVARIQKSVEKYARLVTIVQQDEAALSKEGTREGLQVEEVARVSVGNTSWYEIQMPISHLVMKEFGISVAPQYRGIILPITIVCSESSNITEYVKIVWRGKSVGDYRLPGMLSVEVIAKDKAMEMIKKEGV